MEALVADVDNELKFISKEIETLKRKKRKAQDREGPGKHRLSQ